MQGATNHFLGREKAKEIAGRKQLYHIVIALQAPAAPFHLSRPLHLPPPSRSLPLSILRNIFQRIECFLPQLSETISPIFIPFVRRRARHKQRPDGGRVKKLSIMIFQFELAATCTGTITATWPHFLRFSSNRRITA